MLTNQEQNSATLRIDWVSFSLKQGIYPSWLESHKAWLDYLAVVAPVIDLDSGDTRPVRGRPPYKTITSANGFTLLENHLVPHATVEIEGKACARLGQDAIMRILANPDVQKGLNRLDIALDVQTTVTPAEVRDFGWSDRFLTHSFVDSQTGQTLYVGSPKSDRMVRVYRYAAPHERAHLLRFEYVLRRREAKKAYAYMECNALPALLGTLENIFGWNHPMATQYRIDDRMPQLANDRASIGTVQWLTKQVLPAMTRLEAQGRIPDFVWLEIERLLEQYQRREGSDFSPLDVF